MPTYARISDGIVAELVAVDPNGPALADLFHPCLVAAMVAVPPDSGAGLGWSWDGQAFVAPPDSAQEAPPVPDVTARQLRLWLIAQGRPLSDIDDAIAALPEADRAAAQVEWEYATRYERAHPLIAALAPSIGLGGPAAIDAAFRAAAQL